MHRTAQLILCIASISGFGQDRVVRLTEKFSVKDQVVVNLNSSYTQVIFEPWNKNTVEVSAYIQGSDISEEDQQRLFDSWDLTAVGNSNEITINSLTSSAWSNSVSSLTQKGNLSVKNLQELNPVINDILKPVLQNIENNPMPNALATNLASMDFDYSKYRENEERYIQQWENQIQEKFGDEYKSKMKSLVLQLNENNVTVPHIKTQITVTGNPSAQQLQYWQEQFGRQMVQWASQFAQDVNNVNVQSSITIYQKKAINNGTTGIQKIVKVRMPKEARLKLKVRHGTLDLGEGAVNASVVLSHSQLSAHTIKGKNTFIQASYSPILIHRWEQGKLAISYVKNCRIQNAKDIWVNADSSNIYIQELEAHGAIAGNFGAITIAALGDTFSTLDLVVENSDFKLKLPTSAFNFTYNGVQSRISLPKSLETNVRKNFGNIFINGFQNTRNTDKTISINAKYSDVIFK
ncbi:hypothetical protein ACE939_03680 [Aquimarina sp. W85]|uniref:hypothetical protein n=1 Tax=Aquimarina rhodophyticola TaxID=3342246 RepID=UPI0036722492